VHIVKCNVCSRGIFTQRSVSRGRGNDVRPWLRSGVNMHATLTLANFSESSKPTNLVHCRCEHLLLSCEKCKGDNVNRDEQAELQELH
jgi:hypothetical protein